MLIVSHDRYFLDQVASTIWEMTTGMDIYRGNYSAYLEQREERYQRQLEEYQTQQEFVEKEEDYIRRNIAGQNTRQAQGRRRRLERMLAEARADASRLKAAACALHFETEGALRRPGAAHLRAGDRLCRRRAARCLPSRT